MADETDQVKGHRKAIQEHIDKYRRFMKENNPQAAQTAWRTIEIAQGHIAKLRSRKPSIQSDQLDSWRPSR